MCKKKKEDCPGELGNEILLIFYSETNIFDRYINTKKILRSEYTQVLPPPRQIALLLVGMAVSGRFEKFWLL